MSRVGVYSGTFDPLHLGHIAFAEAAIEQCGLDHVVFLPEVQPRYKPDATVHELRLQSLKLLLTDRDEFSVAELEECQFSVDETLPQLEKLYGNDLALLMGSDVAVNVGTWPHVERLLMRVGLIVGMRTPDDRTKVARNLDQLSARYRIITADYDDISSSQIRSSNVPELKNQ